MNPNGKEYMKNFILKELITSDGFVISLVCESSKRGMLVRFPRLLGMLRLKHDKHIIHLDETGIHRKGEKISGQWASVKLEEMDAMSTNIADYLRATLGLVSYKGKKKKHTQRFTMRVIDPSGQVIFEKLILKWVESSMENFIQKSKEMRAISNDTNLLINSFNEIKK